MKALVGPAEPWTVGALCAQTDPEIFFPEKGGSTRQAKAVCAGCPVRSKCLSSALSQEERFGIWSGLSERERRKLEGPRSCKQCGGERPRGAQYCRPCVAQRHADARTRYEAELRERVS